MHGWSLVPYRGGSFPISPYCSTIFQQSAKVVGSATVGPEAIESSGSPMTETGQPNR